MERATLRQLVRLNNTILRAASCGDTYTVLETLRQIRDVYPGQHYDFDTPAYRLMRSVFPSSRETGDWTTTDVYEREKLCALSAAATSGRTETVKALLALSVDVKSRMAQGILFSVIYRGDRAIARLLVQAGVEVTGKIGAFTYLESAAMSGHRHMVKFLMEQGAKYTADALLYAAMYGHVKVVKFFLEQGVDLTLKTWYGMTVRCTLRCYPPKRPCEEAIRLVEEASRR